MKLLVHELRTELVQQIKTGHKNVLLHAVRPHIYRHGLPAGAVRMELRDESGQVVALSAAVDLAEIGSGTYWHGYQRFYLSAMLRRDTSYQVAMVPQGGYAFDEAAYLGCCNDFDLRRTQAGYSPNLGVNAALDIELWESREALRRVG